MQDPPTLSRVGLPGTGGLRVARALVLSVCAVVLAVGGHLAGGGRPSLTGVLVVAALSSATSLLIAARRLGAAAIAGCMAGGQVGFHLVMSLEPAHTMPSAAGSMTAGTMHGSTGAGMSMGGAPDLRMLVGHVAATVLASLLLARGEHLVWTIAALLTPGVRVLVASGTGAVLLSPRRPREVVDRLVWRVGLLQVGLRHRGPPACATA